MTANKDFKRVVRTRMQKTGETYTAARASVARKAAPWTPTKPEIDYATRAGVKDVTIRGRTGRSWKEWAEILDAVGAHEWTHTAIARHVHTILGVGHWWAQSITVGYERIKGLRAIGQRRGGAFEVNKSRTFAVDLPVLFTAFANSRRRARWLPGLKLVVRKAVANKSIRITWPDGTSVEGWFDAKGPGKSVVALQHTKLADREAVTRTRAFWGERLDALAELLGVTR